MTRTPAVLLLAAVFAIACHQAQPKPAPTPVAPPPPPAAPASRGNPGTGDSATPPAGGRGGRGGGASQAPQPYGQVIRGADLHTRVGLFKTHMIGDSLFYEIPRNEFGRDMLLTTEIEKTPEGMGYGGQMIGSHLVRWEERGRRVLLRGIESGLIASDTTNPVRFAVEAASYAPIIAAFPIAAYGPDSAAVINVTALYKHPPTELSVTSRYRGTIDQNRTFLASVAPYPTNIEVRTDLTINAGGGAGAAPGGGRGGGGEATGSETFLVHWSMLKLPEHPMQPRLYDSRVGFFNNSVTDFAHASQKSETRTFITRYRLECSDQRVGNLCVPKKPITYYVDPATPRWLVPWIKKAITDWQPAFEAAGFKDGIVAREAPTKAEDPDWSAEDARYAVIDWLPSTTENAVGPHTADPRTGEIISAHLQIYHNAMNLGRDWYWTQIGQLDPRARKLPLPDSVIGEAMEWIVAHEIGHSIGLMHDMKGSAMYPADSVRSRTWVHRMGHSPSIMDYSRYNYVAQPEDSIPLADLKPRVGPYDRFAIQWGYMPIPGATSSDAERPALDQLAREQDSLPWLRFAADGSTSDPRRETEAVGDDDPVKSTGYGIRNIKRLVPMLIPATTQPTENNDELTELYGRLIGQWANEISHVANVIGGIETQDKYGSQPGAVFTPVSGTRQRAAMHFISENAFQTPTYFLVPAITSRIEDNSGLAQINTVQARILASVLQDARLARMIEIEAMPHRSADIYTLPELLADVRHGVWGELGASTVRIDPFRRALQHSYLDDIKIKLNPPVVAATPGAPGGGRGGRGGGVGPAGNDVHSLLRMELKTLDGEVVAAEKKAGDVETRAHLDAAHHEIGDILNPKGVASGE
ncbi:MAG: zinc-dependent metalloprotease [Gemmatimonadales bacterium]